MTLDTSPHGQSYSRNPLWPCDVSDPMPEKDLLGAKIGHIRLVDFVAHGGMGSVYVGFDETLERRVAVKAIHDSRRLDAETQGRFKREARVLSSLAHPGICQIHDYIESDGRDFLVLELVAGRDLKHGLEEIASEAARADIAAQIVDVLVAAHSKGIVHRDLKPSNLMLTPEGKVKVLDFGLAQTSEEELLTRSWGTANTGTEGSGSQAHLTRLGTVLGTLEYMSPEQARGEPASAASDMYSLGLVLQELFTRRRPFEEGLDAPALLERARAGATCPVEGIDRDWVALINRLKSIAPPPALGRGRGGAHPVHPQPAAASDATRDRGGGDRSAHDGRGRSLRTGLADRP